MQKKLAIPKANGIAPEAGLSTINEMNHFEENLKFYKAIGAADAAP